MTEVQTATITPQYLNPAKPGKKEGSIKDVNGVFWGCAPELLDKFTVGTPATINYTSREWQGKTYHSVKNLVSSAPKTNGNAAGSANGVYRQTSARDAERMFVAGALNAMIHSGKIQITADNLTGAVRALRSVWAETFGADESGAPF